MVMYKILIILDIINPQIPILHNDRMNRVIVLIIEPIKVPNIASLALPMACILAVSGPCI